MLCVVNVEMACDGAECNCCSATSSFGAEPSKQHCTKGQSGQGKEQTERSIGVWARKLARRDGIKQTSRAGIGENSKFGRNLKGNREI